MTFATQNSPEAYCNSRSKDFHDLLNEISETQGQLGYVDFLTPTTLQIGSETKVFTSNLAAKAYILRAFW